jgi:hypothetical protein
MSRKESKWVNEINEINEIYEIYEINDWIDERTNEWEVRKRDKREDNITTSSKSSRI